MLKLLNLKERSLSAELKKKFTGKYPLLRSRMTPAAIVTKETLRLRVELISP